MAAYEKDEDGFITNVLKPSNASSNPAFPTGAFSPPSQQESSASTPSPFAAPMIKPFSQASPTAQGQQPAFNAFSSPFNTPGAGGNPFAVPKTNSPFDGSSSLASRIGGFLPPEQQTSPPATPPQLNILGAATRSPAPPMQTSFGAPYTPPRSQPSTPSVQSSDDGTKPAEGAPASGSSAAPGPVLINSDTDPIKKVPYRKGKRDPSLPWNGFNVRPFNTMGIAPEILNALIEMKMMIPSKIQERAIPLLMQNPPRNLIGQSQSGTGKTAAFVIAMLSRVDFSKHTTQAVCIAPSRELSLQILSVVTRMGKYTPVTTFAAVKQTNEWGAAKSPTVQTSAQIIVGTPGTFLEMMRKRCIDPKDVKLFVIDEADNMLDVQGMGDQTLRAKNLLPKDVQLVLFSATYPDRVRNYADRFAPEANKIELKANELALKAVKQFYIDCPDNDTKYDVLAKIYYMIPVGASVVFTGKRDEADKIAAKMIAEGHQVSSLHGAKDVDDRDKIMDDFRNFRTRLLVTTNVIARGLDLPTVTMVINYDLPRDRDGKPDIETYLHRIGRTGRFGATGIAINFVHDKASWAEVREIEKALGQHIIRVDGTDYTAMKYVLQTEMDTLLHGEKSEQVEAEMKRTGVTPRSYDMRELLRNAPFRDPNISKDSGPAAAA